MSYLSFEVSVSFLPRYYPMNAALGGDLIKTLLPATSEGISLRRLSKIGSAKYGNIRTIPKGYTTYLTSLLRVSSMTTYFMLISAELINFS